MEKSAGGKEKEKRKQKITEFREHQNDKLKEIITNILNEYEAKNVLKVSGNDSYISCPLHSLYFKLIN